jgi:protein tyrosine phosphatase (PTP) superfamily phosphohydrolase (DUF442 family)
MAKTRQMTKQKLKKAKSLRPVYILVFVVSVVVVCAAVYLVSTQERWLGVLFSNKQLNIAGDVPRPVTWAHPLELPGVPNLHKVSDDLYRGAQPSAEGMEQLKKLGVRTVVNLRSLHSDRDEIADTGLGYEHIRMETWNPETEDVVRFLKIITDSNCTPVFVHCQRGADRTGMMCAVYRIAVQGWSGGEAMEEMTKGGFGFYSGWQDLVDYVLKLDADEIKRSAGLSE